MFLVLCGITLVSAAPDDLLDAGYNDMYNLQFEDAHKAFGQWERLHAQDPLGPVSDAAAYLFSEFDRLHILQSELFVDDHSFLNRKSLTPDPAVKARFEKALENSQRLADAELKHSPNDKEALFARVLCFGLEADYTALIEKRNLASLSEVKQGRAMAEKLLSEDPNYYDAYLAIGVENYLLSLKPAPIRWLLQAGGAQANRETGITNLKLTASKGHYLQPYAELLLAVAALRSKDDAEAKRLLSDLAKRFPRNPLYVQELKKIT